MADNSFLITASPGGARTTAGPPSGAGTTAGPPSGASPTSGPPSGASPTSGPPSGASPTSGPPSGAGTTAGPPGGASPTSAPTVTCSKTMTSMKNQRITGQEIGDVIEDLHTGGECWEECGETPQCVAADFNADWGECQLYSSVSDTYQEADYEAVKCEKGIYNL